MWYIPRGRRRHIERQGVGASAQRRPCENLLARIRPVLVAVEIDPAIELAGHVGSHVHRRRLPRHQRRGEDDAVFVVDARQIVARRKCVRLPIGFGINARAQEHARLDHVPRPVVCRQRRVTRWRRRIRRVAPIQFRRRNVDHPTQLISGRIPVGIHQVNRLLRFVRLPRRRRLVSDHRSQMHRRAGVHRHTSNRDLEEDVKEAVGHACRHERQQVERARPVVRLLLDHAQ